jgi:hypothetical protein
MEKDKVGGSSGIDGYLFRLIATFEAAAMQQLGKIAHPLTGDVEVDLAGASDSIEMLAAIQRKTEGNLNDDEKRLLEHVLFQLRMNYVDVSKDKTASGDGSAAAGAPEATDTESDTASSSRVESEEAEDENSRAAGGDGAGDGAGESGGDGAGEGTNGAGGEPRRDDAPGDGSPEDEEGR